MNEDNNKDNLVKEISLLLLTLAQGYTVRTPKIVEFSMYSIFPRQLELVQHFSVICIGTSNIYFYGEHDQVGLANL